MNVLDENIVAPTCEQLRRWRIPFRQIGEHLSTYGADDANIIPFLLRLPQPTFFTHDEDFFKTSLCHAAYGLVHLDVSDRDAAGAIRRFLKHAEFNTQRKRMGLVARVRLEGVRFWRRGVSILQTASWIDE